MQDAGRVAVAERCAFMAAAGDLFDANLLKPQIVLGGLECLSESPRRQPTFLPAGPDWLGVIAAGDEPADFAGDQ